MTGISNPLNLFVAAGVKSKSSLQCMNSVLLILNHNWTVLRNSLIAGILIFVIVVTTVIIIKMNNNKSNDISYEDPYYNDTVGNHSVIYRKQWGGVPPKIFPLSLKHPVDLLIVSSSLKTFCNSSDACVAAVKNLQKSDQLVKHFPDVQYNFMIGGDARIYVGNGWDNRNFHKKTSIGIDFLGNYVFDELTDGMIDAFHKLVEQGLQLGKLSKEYKLVGENQTDSSALLSPGPNVVRLMQSWPHFYNNTWF